MYILKLGQAICLLTLACGCSKNFHGDSVGQKDVLLHTYKGSKFEGPPFEGPETSVHEPKRGSVRGLISQT